MPAEWEEHESTWLAWPNSRYHNFWEDRLEGVQNISLQIIKGLNESEKVKLLIADKEMEREVKSGAKKQRINL